ncbi:MAG TPA: hypothetical protein VHO07_10810, partial [Streptosporangiaceae bacterium]|nr:hypothetical protein [Streptosporangiaceae bacterium]
RLSHDPAKTPASFDDPNLLLRTWPGSPDVEEVKKRDNLPSDEAGCYQIEADKNGASNLR